MHVTQEKEPFSVELYQIEPEMNNDLQGLLHNHHMVSA